MEPEPVPKPVIANIYIYTPGEDLEPEPVPKLVIANIYIFIYTPGGIWSQNLFLNQLLQINTNIYIHQGDLKP